MPEIGTQLRTYFDETVERTTEEDVRIRATTARGVPVAGPRFRPRPLAAGAIGFGLAMTLLGVVLVADRVFGAGMSDVGNGGGGGTVGTTPGAGQGSLWLFVPVVFGLGMLATGIISARRRNGDMRERGEGMMQSIETVEAVESPLDKQILTLRKRDRRLAWLAGILAVAVVAMGAWMIFGDAGGQSLTAEQEQMIKTVEEAGVHWNAGDGEALAALYMPSGYHDNGSTRYYVAEGKLADYVTSLGSVNFSVRSGEHYVIGNYVFSEGYIPQQSETVRPGIHAMSADGKRILWHLAP